MRTHETQYHHLLRSLITLPALFILFHPHQIITNAFPNLSRHQNYHSFHPILSNPFYLNPLKAAAKSSSSSSFRPITSSPDLIRGDRYGTTNNSTIPTPQEVADIVGVRPSREASKRTWQRAWKIHKRALPFLHIIERGKKNKVVDSSLNLACLWWKALAGNDVTSPAFDEGLSFDLLPPGTRHIVNKKLVKLGIFPRLHHANVEIRTVFLDNSVKEVIQLHVQKQEPKQSTPTKYRLISMGAGYDVRSIKLLSKGIIDEAYELDLPEVVEAKQMLLGPRRLLKRRPQLKEEHMPKLIGVDLNSISSFRQVLRDILESTPQSSNTKDFTWHNIFLFEGVMIYLDEGIPTKLLQTCSSVAQEAKSLKTNQNGPLFDGASLCLADRMENVPGGDKELGTAELKRTGWKLITWLPKPGLARHMCSATLTEDI